MLIHCPLVRIPFMREPTCMPVLLLDMMRFWVPTGARFSDCLEVAFQIFVPRFALAKPLDGSGIPLVRAVLFTGRLALPKPPREDFDNEIRLSRQISLQPVDILGAERTSLKTVRIRPTERQRNKGNGRIGCLESEAYIR